MKNKLLQRILIVLWVLLLLSMGVYYLLFAPRGSDFTESENRTLAAFPEVTVDSVFSGRFGEEFETYLLDRFPIRNEVISLVNRFQSAVSLADHNEYLLIAEDVEDPLDTADYEDSLEVLLQDMTAATEPATEPAPSQPQEAEPEKTQPVENPPIEKKPPMTLEDFPTISGMYLDIGKGELEMKSYHIKNVAAVTAVLNKYAALLPENGKLLFTMGPPSYVVNTFVNGTEQVSFYNTWDEIVNGLGADNVYAFDSSEILSHAIKRGEYVSFRTDNHWTPYGAGLVYTEMAKRAGKTPSRYPDDFDITVEELFRGTYYRDDPGAYYHVEPDRLELLMPKIGVEYRQITKNDEYSVIDFLDYNAKSNDRYAVYLGGPGGPWRYVQCDNEETENCLVITDSFGLTVIPYLTYNYNQVHYYDARYYDYYAVGSNVAEMIEKYHIHDIYVIVADFH
ncbi:MAG: hypothetical protein IJB15_14235, partial [Clostridia bacterium]|nr:hypothetical protein [Clostridia bacterium]